jgi:hypothetical protein
LVELEIFDADADPTIITGMESPNWKARGQREFELRDPKPRRLHTTDSDLNKQLGEVVTVSRIPTPASRKPNVGCEKAPNGQFLSNLSKWSVETFRIPRFW